MTPAAGKTAVKIAGGTGLISLVVRGGLWYGSVAMDSKEPPRQRAGLFGPLGYWYAVSARRAWSVLIYTALLCTLAAKLFHALRSGMLSEYPRWIVADIAFLLTADVVLSLVCFRRPTRWVIRAATFTAAIVCTWSFVNAGWLIRTGTQVLPTVLVPLFRDPVNILALVGVNIARMKWGAVLLLTPGGIALAFVIAVLARPAKPEYAQARLAVKIATLLAIAGSAALAYQAARNNRPSQIPAPGLRYNCQLRALLGLVVDREQQDYKNSTRLVPTCDEIQLEKATPAKPAGYNIVMVVLEGVQYRCTSLAGGVGEKLTPYLAALAGEGVEFTNAHSTLTHTTKALFTLLTGRYPSVSHDIVETVPVEKPYAGLATILEKELGYRTAFFQSAKGNFEARPGLVHNLGFDAFWARDDSNKPDAYLGYLACDEFVMIDPIIDWIRADSRPFLLVLMCSVTHDPYEVPRWFAEPADKPFDRYKQAIRYTDGFIKALDGQLQKLGLHGNTIFCVVGDHGEGFGEHGRFGHERIAFEEGLHVPFVLRAPGLVEPGRKVPHYVGLIDVTPTLLALVGLDTKQGGFAGTNVLGPVGRRRLFFSGWLNPSPAGFIEAGRKFIYDAVNDDVFAYDLEKDPGETTMLALSEQQAASVVDQVKSWKAGSIMVPRQSQRGSRMLFGRWFCRWNNRNCDARYCPQPPQVAKRTTAQR